MPKVIAFLALLACVGCSSVSGTRSFQDAQGNTQTLTIRSKRVLWSSEGITTSTKDANGFEFDLKVSKSNPNVEALSAVAEAAAKGAVQGVK